MPVQTPVQESAWESAPFAAPVVRIVRGNPDDSDIAALVAALALVSAGADEAACPAGQAGPDRPGWSGGSVFDAPGSWARGGGGGAGHWS